MTKLHRTKTIDYSAKQMFALVNDVQHYPEFLPWCNAAEILSEGEREIVASIEVEAKGIRQSFTTRNKLQPYQRIDMDLVEGPFKIFTSHWLFEDLEGGGSRVDLNMEFEFSKKMMSFLLKPLFDRIANTLVDAFCERAEKVYSK